MSLLKTFPVTNVRGAHSLTGQRFAAGQHVAKTCCRAFIETMWWPERKRKGGDK